ncbi:MAG TPA: hypothetical protein V6C65_04525 [Allocoleopsis sp.]
MTPEQQSLFIRISQQGAAIGYAHRYEHLFHCLKWLKSDDEKKAAIGAFAAFERGCGFCEESAIQLEEMTDEEYWEFVVSYCNEKKQAA